MGGALPQQVEQLARSSSLVFKQENYFAGKGMVGAGKVSQVQINCVGLMTNQCGRGPGDAGVARRRQEGGLETGCKSTYVLSGGIWNLSCRQQGIMENILLVFLASPLEPFSPLNNYLSQVLRAGLALPGPHVCAKPGCKPQPQ